jgi:hypothetical protein
MTSVTSLNSEPASKTGKPALDTIPDSANESASTSTPQVVPSSQDHQKSAAPYDKENSWLRPMLRVYANVNTDVRTVDLNGEHYQVEKGRPSGNQTPLGSAPTPFTLFEASL